ncbi:MAG: MiaB/RimO family radical SAM methylthiotransferase [Alphaproteobacteria bacterium]|nr:MiaB/RimO family radical SAM methylthiotransferase [Alphaproteobacteria bacterium]
MQEKNIKSLSFGCRLNALECEKIKNIISNCVDTAVIVNTCAVTAEAERQSAQSVRRVARENPNVPIFVTGCGATRNPALFQQIPNTIVIPNSDKMNPAPYIDGLAKINTDGKIVKFAHETPELSKQFIQIQNGCNHKCTYCVTRLLRGPAVSFPYENILADARAAVERGFFEIVITGVDSASYAYRDGDKVLFISDVCEMLLRDVPEIRRLRISSLDPASPQIFKIIDLIHRDNRMMPHLHLSMQSGSDTILSDMARRHNADMVRKIVAAADGITFGWDIICGFPGETDELFRETLDLARELKTIKIHAFPYSPRPGTTAAVMPNQIPRNISKARVHKITDVADKNLSAYAATQIGKTVSCLVENNNIGRTPDDIDVVIFGAPILPRTICNVKLTGVENGIFIGERI